MRGRRAAPSWRVLDVATGNGGTAIAAARRGCEVVGIDYVPSLVAQARERAAAERYAITFDEGDAEALPYADSSFDAVLSTLGVMFTADHRRAAAEMLRVCRSRGVLAMANWSPDGFIGRVFRTIGAHVPPPAGVKSPALWGTTAYLEELFGDHISGMRAETRHFMFRYRSPEHFLQFLRINYGPMLKAFEALDEEGRQGLAADLTALMAECNTAVGTLAIPSAYLEVVATRA